MKWTGVQYDSRRVRPGDAFVAMRGETSDGNAYVAQALERGAAAIFTDSAETFAELSGRVEVKLVENGRRALAELAAEVYGHPERALKVSAVTGTNGKTTTAWLLEQMLRSVGRKCVLIGTIETHVDDEVRASEHTTPEASDLYKLFADGVAAGCTEVVMEMSSHALAQERVWGVPVDVAMFTNFTQDHLDYHGTMGAYYSAKAKLFSGVGASPPRISIVNVDDAMGTYMASHAQSSGSPIVWRYGLGTDKYGPDFSAENISMRAGATSFSWKTPWGTAEMLSPLTGRVNVYNLLAASCAAVARGLSMEQIADAAKNLQQVPGRFQTVPNELGITVVVDYAHTDDALRNLIALARELVGDGRVITLFGCGGDRDKTKRPKMGRAAGEGSDLVVLTSDNPRSEDPAVILDEALAGVRETDAECIVEMDRAAAIGIAIRAARRGDIVLLAGKGHEKVQILRDGTIPFDDVDVAARSAEGDWMKLTLGQVADWIHAEGDFTTDAEAVGYSIDSRTIGAGELFFAVTGERVDGHDYVEAALANGAVAAVVSSRWLAPDDSVDPCKLLRVPDGEDCVLKAMQTLAREVRRGWGGRVIGITGSAGKTTTKEMVATVLSAEFKVLKSAGNLNNHFGVPLQLLRLEPEHEVAVIEMGMNHAGELTALAKIAEPNWAVVSNVAAVHLEFFPEGIAGIAKAKYELVQALPPDGIAFLNADDVHVAAMAAGLGERAVMYGAASSAAVRAEDVRETGADGVAFTVLAEDDQAEVALHLLGRHNVSNALAAIAVGVRSGMTLAECAAALGEMRAPDKRGVVLEWRGATIINDSYNSNPAALDAMVDALMAMKAERHIVVAGEMLELGPEGPALHRACGERMVARGVDVVVGVRGLAAEFGGLFVETPREAGEWLAANLRAGDGVLLKASRGVKLEGALELLR